MTQSNSPEINNDPHPNAPSVHRWKFERIMKASRKCIACDATDNIHVLNLSFMPDYEGNTGTMKIRIEAECDYCGFVIIEHFSKEVYTITIE